MAIYSYHRLILGKEEIDNFFCLNGDIWIFFIEMFIEKSSAFHKTFIQIVEFDRLYEGRPESFKTVFIKTKL